jgi:hypothetical protein
MAINQPGTATPLAKTAPPPLPLSVPPVTQYEFSRTENAIIGNLGSKMSFVGLFMLGIGLFFFVSAIVRWFKFQYYLEVGLIFLSLLFMVVGVWTHRAGREFRNIADTQGNDMAHLMGALDNLHKLYTLLHLIFFVALIFAIIQLGAHSLYGVLDSFG